MKKILMIDACETESTVGDADGTIIIYQISLKLFLHIFFSTLIMLY